MNKVKHFQEMQRCNKCFVVGVVYVCIYNKCNHVIVTKCVLDKTYRANI